LYNQEAAGFGIRLLCALTEPRAGYLDGVNVMVRQDIWNRRPFRSLSDLRGHSVDGAAEGNPIDMLIRYALIEAKLTTDDVKLSYKIRSPSDVPYLFREKQVDLAGVSEPTATFIQQRGLATKWMGYSQVVPWFQDTFLGASEDFVRYRADEARALVRAYLRAAREVGESQGHWTPHLLATSAKWTKLKTEDLQATGRLPYWSQTGDVDPAALRRVQDFWFERRMVRDRANIDRLVGTRTGAAA
jgi:ABC-type nitrate/sulfonate/bicarbonate transport system substrate-binding protein